jgi:hypothetical protein
MQSLSSGMAQGNWPWIDHTEEWYKQRKWTRWCVQDISQKTSKINIRQLIGIYGKNKLLIKYKVIGIYIFSAWKKEENYNVLWTTRPKKGNRDVGRPRKRWKHSETLFNVINKIKRSWTVPCLQYFMYRICGGETSERNFRIFTQNTVNLHWKVANMLPLVTQ